MDDHEGTQKKISCVTCSLHEKMADSNSRNRVARNGLGSVREKIEEKQERSILIPNTAGPNKARSLNHANEL